MSESASGPRHSNHLVGETSPYLLQHAHNPVEWYPWGPEALGRARREDKPIFLSVGYSTCYWCHVMERQSFENETVAAEMNRLFVNIKVDREERPDVDQLYMTAVQLITRHGGWPMSVWLTPDLRPYYGGTYFPPDRFVATLRALEDAYRNRRDEVDQSADQIVGFLRRLARPGAPEQPLRVGPEFLDALIDRSTDDFEPQFGGFGGAPKFPRETLLELLLVYLEGATGGDAGRAKKLAGMLRRTLDAMADGGIRDQLGGGFHRYSTDARWLVPHFEIMLYDNAMLGWIYARASRQFDEPRYARVARGVFDFVLREMTSPDGAFYTAFDAEVDAREGLSYLWTAAEIESILGKGDAQRFNRVYGVDRGPNFADPHHSSGTPDANILFLPEPLAAVAAAMGTTEDALDGELAPMRARLLEARAKRKQPMLDTKVLTGWNALMVRALAYAGRALGDADFVRAAERCARFLLDRHLTPDGRLYRSSREGSAKYFGFLDDYAFLAQALQELHAATGDEQWRNRANEILRHMQDRFADPSAGGFFFTDAGADDLIVRQKTAQDSPLPSGNAVAAMALLEAGETADARDVLSAFASTMDGQAEAMSSMVQAALVYVRREGEFVASPAEATPAADRPDSPRDVARGIVRLTPEWMNAADLHLRLEVLDGFHINAHETASDIPLIPTTVTVDHPGATVEYPPGEEQTFAFLDRPLRVYRGSVLLRIRFSPPATPDTRVKLTLQYQACDESACLPPVRVSTEVEVPSVH